jgi:hypothetical protein
MKISGMLRVTGLTIIAMPMLFTFPAATASATPVAAASRFAQGCSGDTCILLSGNAGSNALLQAWAFQDTFTGVFVASGPNNFMKTSPNKRWIGGKVNFWSITRSNAPAGQYCMSGFSNSSGFEGTACETLS